MHSPCPPDHTLARYAGGELDDATAAAVDAHLAGCDRCLTRLDHPAATRPAPDRLTPASSAAAHPPALERAIAAAIDGSAAAFALPSIPGYQLLERIGQGGMGTVYKALHLRLGKAVAVKVLRRGRTHDPDAIARFEREMLAVGRLDHPHIVRATDAGEAGGVHFLVMEFIRGTDLSRLVKAAGPLPLAEACRCVVQAAAGLDAAHRHGIVHRDVKPSNLMRTPDGVVKVLDLGLACLPVAADTPPPSPDAPPPDARPGHLTETGHAVGTRDYMAPEQQSAPQAVGPAADVYGLGATLWHLLTGHPPPRQPGLFPLPPEAAALPAELWQRLLAPDPADRLPSAAAVAAVLKPYTGPSHPTARRPRRWFVAAAAAAAAGVFLALMAVGGLVFPRPPASATSTADPNRPPGGKLPMTDVEAAALQQRWAESLGVPPRADGPHGLRFALVPPGELGLSTECRVRITRPYYLGTCEVTVGQFRAFVAATGHNTVAESTPEGGELFDLDVTVPDRRARTGPDLTWRTPGYPTVTDDHPVTQVYWADADAFCRWLTDTTGRPHRLPTEAEWAWAARAGDDRSGTFPATDPNLQRHAWLRTNSGKPVQPQPVGRLLANVWGLHDTLGNVAEVCDDFLADYPAGTHPDYRGGRPDHHRSRVLMGGTYMNVFTGYGGRGNQKTCGGHAGFRVVRAVE